MKRKVTISNILMPTYLVCLILLAYSLPTNILDSQKYIGSIIHIFQEIIPSIKNFGDKSSFPQIAQLVFLLEILSIPILAYVAFSETRPKGIPSIPLLIGGSFLVLMFFYAYVFWLPGDGLGSGFSSRISQSMVDSKLAFVIFTSIFTFTLAGSVGGLIKNILAKSQ